MLRLKIWILSVKRDEGAFNTPYGNISVLSFRLDCIPEVM